MVGKGLLVLEGTHKDLTCAVTDQPAGSVLPGNQAADQIEFARGTFLPNIPVRENFDHHSRVQ